MKDIDVPALSCPGGVNELYMRHVQLNEEFFRKNYLENNLCATVQYEDCMLDFLPITENEYVAIDKKIGRSCGIFVVRPYEDKACEETISSVLIANEWDIRKIFPVIQQKKWVQIYLVLNQAIVKFASFFKLSGFIAALPPNIKFFATEEEMRQYFINDHDAYLPSEIVALEPEKYRKIFEGIHDERIRSGVPSNNVFLSICLPTYNRGELALKSIKTALTSNYDAEIEFIVCDNGSTVGIQAYKEIENIKDSRLRYYRSPQNNGFSFNIINCLEHAKGYFVFFISDEDTLFVENMETVLHWLASQKEQMGACIFSEEGEPFERRDYDPGIDAVIRAYCMSYLSGVCLNMYYIRLWDVFTQVEAFQDNSFFLDYTYCVFGVLLAKHLKVIDSDIKFWCLQKEASAEHDWGDTNGIPSAWLPERRICESRDAVMLAKDFFDEDGLKAIFMNRMIYFYHRYTSDLYVYKDFGKKIKTMYCWSDVCINQYKNCLQTLLELGERIKNIPSFLLKLDKEFFRYLVYEKTQEPYTPEENLLLALQAQLAKYCYDTGIPIEKIDFVKCEEYARDLLKNLFHNRITDG